MTKRDEDLTPDARDFVQRVNQAYAPAPLTRTEAADFDAAIEVNLRSVRWPWMAAPAAVMAIVLAVLLLPMQQGSNDVDWLEPMIEIEAYAAGDDYESIDDFLPDNTLPDEYEAIALLIDPLGDEQ